jgi:hypothetical protein
MSTEAFHHLILSLDVQDSGTRADPGQRLLRRVVHDAVRSAFAAAQISPDGARAPEDRGDGVLLVLPAEVPKARVVGRWVAELRESLRVSNAVLRDPVRVRVGIHGGELHHDAYGVAGVDVNLACRLANCDPAKQTLRAASTADLVVTVSDVIYRGVIRHGGPHLDPATYRQYHLTTAEYDGPVWLHLPGYARPPDPVPSPATAPQDRPPPSPDRGIHIHDHGSLVRDNGTLGTVVLGDATWYGDAP